MVFVRDMAGMGMGKRGFMFRVLKERNGDDGVSHGRGNSGHKWRSGAVGF